MHHRSPALMHCHWHTYRSSMHLCTFSPLPLHPLFYIYIFSQSLWSTPSVTAPVGRNKTFCGSSLIPPLVWEQLQKTPGLTTRQSKALYWFNVGIKCSLLNMYCVWFVIKYSHSDSVPGVFLNFCFLTSKENNGWQKFRKFKLNYTSSLEAGSRREDERFIIKPESWKAKTNHLPPLSFSFPARSWMDSKAYRKTPAHMASWLLGCLENCELMTD